MERGAACPNAPGKIKEMKHFEIRQVVVGFEFGQTDENLLKYLQYLGLHIPIANRHFVHVIPAPQLLDTLYESLAGHFDIKEEVLERLQKKLSAEFAQAGTTNTFQAIEGDPLKEVLAVASEKEADLVVIGQKADTHKHGILAKSLARSVGGNALVIPENAPIKISKIVVPIDFSANSAKAFQAALALKKQLQGKAEIVCLHVFAAPNLRSYDLGKYPEQFKQLLRQSREEVFQNFKKDHGTEEDQHIELILIEKMGGAIAHYIMEFVRESEADLVMIGAKGHSTVERLWLGSVTEKLLSVNESTATLVVR